MKEKGHLLVVDTVKTKLPTEAALWAYAITLEVSNEHHLFSAQRTRDFLVRHAVHAMAIRRRLLLVRVTESPSSLSPLAPCCSGGLPWLSMSCDAQYVFRQCRMENAVKGREATERHYIRSFPAPFRLCHPKIAAYNW